VVGTHLSGKTSYRREFDYKIIESDSTFQTLQSVFIFQMAWPLISLALQKHTSLHMCVHIFTFSL